MLIPLDSPAKSTDRKAADLVVRESDPSRIAVLLNRNARKVTDRLAKKVERLVGSDNIFYSRSLEEAEAFSREIVQRGYGTVVCGGGDGTLVSAVNLVQRYIDESNTWRTERYQRLGEVQDLLRTPRFAFLKLGTGNGISRIIGARSPVDDLKNLIDFAPGREYGMSLIENEDERFFLAGMGYDSMLLNDYNDLKNRLTNPFLRPFTRGVVGYFTAAFSRTLPRMAFTRRATLSARVVTKGPAYYVDPRRGDSMEVIEPGTTLFEGRAVMIGASTIPFFGYGFKAFPFSRIMPGMMNLRVLTTGPFKIIANLPSVWKGSFRHAGVQDFLVKDVSVELENPFPYQHSGDAQGMRDRVDYRVSDNPLRLVDFYRQRRLTASS